MEVLTVEEYTTPGPICVDPDQPLKDVIQEMEAHGFRHVPVVVGNKAVGIISERDVNLVASFSHFNNLTVKDVMREEPYAVSPETPLAEVALAMSHQKIGSAIVQDSEGKIYGIFTSTDALNALVEILRELTKTTPATF